MSEDTPLEGLLEYDSAADTLQHIMTIQQYLHRVVKEFLDRADWHDRSKLRGEEKATFDRVTPKLKTLTYGSEEYKASLKDMGPALELHYKANPGHHPEAHPNGINDMNLFDMIEMFIDWKAASQRHRDGCFNDSLNINAARFGMSEQLLHIFKNTADYCGWRYDTNVCIEIAHNAPVLSRDERVIVNNALVPYGYRLSSNFEPLLPSEYKDVRELHMDLNIQGASPQYSVIRDTEEYGQVDPDDVDTIISVLKALPELQGENVRSIWSNKPTGERMSPDGWQQEGRSDRRTAWKEPPDRQPYKSHQGMFNGCYWYVMDYVHAADIDPKVLSQLREKLKAMRPEAFKALCEKEVKLLSTKKRPLMLRSDFKEIMTSLSEKLLRQVAAGEL